MRFSFFPVAATVGLGLWMSLATLSPVRADEATESGGIQWVDGWDAGVAAAGKANQLLFVYVGRKSPR